MIKGLIGEGMDEGFFRMDIEPPWTAFILWAGVGGPISIADAKEACISNGAWIWKGIRFCAAASKHYCDALWPDVFGVDDQCHRSSREAVRAKP